ncbi:hypothetical protein PVOR_08585 [Paenibacillus vortex V453]|uniref:Uncharacterized protein n=1 Tax=Paenibacillus vortex V453 TaxID=715225 RepID=A0A2R9SYA0_9BACL|nr:hypothetical protein PVOR_08585 [Paenibacillus vortex V453]
MIIELRSISPIDQRLLKLTGAVSGQSRAASLQVNRTVGQAEGTGSQSNSTNTVNAVTCRRCKSQQVVANKRGYSFANLFKTLGIMILFGILIIVSSYLFSMYSVSDGSRAFMQIFIALGAISFFLSLPVSILVGSEEEVRLLTVV